MNVLVMMDRVDTAASTQRYSRTTTLDKIVGTVLSLNRSHPQCQTEHQEIRTSSFVPPLPQSMLKYNVPLAKLSSYE